MPYFSVFTKFIFHEWSVKVTQKANEKSERREKEKKMEVKENSDNG